MIWIDLQHKRPTDTDIPKWTPWSPTKWADWEAESQRLVAELAALQAAGKIDERNAMIDAHDAHWGKLKDWLLALSEGKCWFSEARELYSHYDVEHFRPKKEAKALDATIRDGYWWLAFDYMNFRACGNVGNRKKGGWFPLHTQSMCSSYDSRCEESESPYLLDPIDIDDVGLLAFDEEGKAVAAQNCSDWEKDRVAETVKRLKLNEHVPLAEARRKVWGDVHRLIGEYRRAKSRCRQGCNPAAHQNVKNSAMRIHEMTLRSSELSAVAKWCVLLHNDPQLAKLVA